MYKVKFHQNFESDSSIYKKVCQMSPNNSGVFGKILVVEDDDCDIFVILNHPQHNQYDPKRTIVFESETPTTRNNFPKFYHGRESDFLYIHDTKSHFNVDLWYHGLVFDDINNSKLFKKIKTFSIINSNLNNLPGHIYRNNFISNLSDVIEFDLFGRFYTQNKHYKGPLDKKFHGLVEYKYTFNCENDFELNYFTEKILDGIFCECLTFYCGCPNIDKFINPNSFINLNNKNISESLDIIDYTIKNDLWKDYELNIKEEKRRISVDYNILNLVNNILEKV